MTTYQIGNKVVTTITNGQVKKNELYMVTAVREQVTPFGTYVYYTIKNAETGRTVEIANGHLVLKPA